jgi:hypothetical protein
MCPVTHITRRTGVSGILVALALNTRENVAVRVPENFRSRFESSTAEAQLTSRSSLGDKKA